KAAGAVMGANFALEQALWFAPPGVAGAETPTYRRSEAFPIVRAECRAVRSAVGLYETTNYGKYEITGRGARAWLDRVFASRIPRPGRFALAPMLNPAGRIVGDLSIACLADDRFLIVGSGFAEEFHLRWFSASDPPPDVSVRSAASTLCGCSMAGPKSRELLQKLVRLDLSAGAFKLFDVRETAVGFAPAILTRAGFTGELGYEVWITPDYFATLYYDILAAGHDLGLTHFGGRALSSLRLEKAYGSFNKDFRPDHTPGETGLDRFVDFSKSEFTGRSAALAERGLRRDLTARRMTMIAIGGAIGTGLFLGSGFAIGLAGPGVLVSYVIGALIALLLMGCLAEMTVAHPTSGSFGAYAEHYIGPLTGYLVRYAYWTGNVLAVGTEVTAIALYMHFWFPSLPGWLSIVGFSALLIAVNARSVNVFGAVEYWFSAIKVTAIV